LNQFKRLFVIKKPVQEVFKVLSDVEQYHTFIPYCIESKITEEQNDYSLVTLNIEFFGIQTSFTTKNVVKNNKSIEMDLIEGPFEKFKSSWRLEEVDHQTTSLSFEMNYQMRNKILEMAFKKNLKTVSESIIKAFKSRLN
jgi:ribosome-associated toxin RatA of RatAB toxin-antitoxin module